MLSEEDNVQGGQEWLLVGPGVSGYEVVVPQRSLLSDVWTKSKLLSGGELIVVSVAHEATVPERAQQGLRAVIGAVHLLWQS